jgi:hypothetical protein
MMQHVPTTRNLPTIILPYTHTERIATIFLLVRFAVHERHESSMTVHARPKSLSCIRCLPHDTAPEKLILMPRHWACLLLGMTFAHAMEAIKWSAIMTFANASPGNLQPVLDFRCT